MDGFTACFRCVTALGHKNTVSPKSSYEVEFVMVFGPVAKTFGSMDATVEPPWMGLRRVFDTGPNTSLENSTSHGRGPEFSGFESILRCFEAMDKATLASEF